MSKKIFICIILVLGFILLYNYGFTKNEYYYEIKCLRSNNKGGMTELDLPNAIVYKLKKITYRGKQASEEVVFIDKNVNVKIKIWE